MNAARFLIREEARAHGIFIRVGGSGGCQQRLFGVQICHRSNHHLDTNNPLTAANQPSSYLKSFFSTLPAAAAVEKKNTQQTKKENNTKKSPHSKLLRVCSDRNANSHFAAIEGMCFFLYIMLSYEFVDLFQVIC